MKDAASLAFRIGWEIVEIAVLPHALLACLLIVMLPVWRKGERLWLDTSHMSRCGRIESRVSFLSDPLF